MRSAQDIILKPIITEDSMMRIADKKYTFRVAVDANKIEIAKAVEALVNTMNCKGRQKRVGRNVGYKPNWKKAIVTLKEDSKGIEFFEGMN